MSARAINALLELLATLRREESSISQQLKDTDEDIAALKRVIALLERIGTVPAPLEPLVDTSIQTLEIIGPLTPCEEVIGCEQCGGPLGASPIHVEDVSGSPLGAVCSEACASDLLLVPSS